MHPPQEYDTGLTPDEIDPERPRPLETPWGTLAIYRLEDEFLCSQAFCPHLEGPLFQGTLSGATITCPWHQWRYDLRSGRCIERLSAAPANLDADAEEHGYDATLVRCDVKLSRTGTLVLRPIDTP